MDDSKSGKDGPMKEGEQVRARNTIKVILKKKKSNQNKELLSVKQKGK